ncbi:hypothetical protein JZ751_028778 [Albula glossodonta]|uniref:Uncharacterized protein n=1 Tax=Albula glossodonta TaxID=121402 RepID=A0A8T2NIA0_9TELE|nr:hypothetical protein JZ751_028778 [Albula glossodonta]
MDAWRANTRMLAPRAAGSVAFKTGIQESRFTTMFICTGRRVLQHWFLLGREGRHSPRQTTMSHRLAACALTKPDYAWPQDQSDNKHCVSEAFLAACEQAEDNDAIAPIQLAGTSDSTARVSSAAVVLLVWLKCCWATDANPNDKAHASQPTLPPPPAAQWSCVLFACSCSAVTWAPLAQGFDKERLPWSRTEGCQKDIEPIHLLPMSDEENGQPAIKGRHKAHQLFPKGQEEQMGWSHSDGGQAQAHVRLQRMILPSLVSGDGPHDGHKRLGRGQSGEGIPAVRSQLLHSQAEREREREADFRNSLRQMAAREDRAFRVSSGLSTRLPPPLTWADECLSALPNEAVNYTSSPMSRIRGEPGYPEGGTETWSRRARKVGQNPSWFLGQEEFWQATSPIREPSPQAAAVIVSSREVPLHRLWDDWNGTQTCNHPIGRQMTPSDRSRGDTAVWRERERARERERERETDQDRGTERQKEEGGREENRERQRGRESKKERGMSQRLSTLSWHAALLTAALCFHGNVAAALGLREKGKALLRHPPPPNPTPSPHDADYPHSGAFEEFPPLALIWATAAANVTVHSTESGFTNLRSLCHSHRTNPARLRPHCTPSWDRPPPVIGHKKPGQLEKHFSDVHGFKLVNSSHPLGHEVPPERDTTDWASRYISHSEVSFISDSW